MPGSVPALSAETSTTTWVVAPDSQILPPGRRTVASKNQVIIRVNWACPATSLSSATLALSTHLPPDLPSLPYFRRSELVWRVRNPLQGLWRSVYAAGNRRTLVGARSPISGSCRAEAGGGVRPGTSGLGPAESRSPWATRDRTGLGALVMRKPDG
ncbi:hypothetical protein VTG60DRAFT_1058 [Thermothelomyces hinnuleus]